jgi:hypothetical protein
MLCFADSDLLPRVSSRTLDVLVILVIVTYGFFSF